MFVNFVKLILSPYDNTNETLMNGLIHRLINFRLVCQLFVIMCVYNTAFEMVKTLTYITFLPCTCNPKLVASPDTVSLKSNFSFESHLSLHLLIAVCVIITPFHFPVNVITSYIYAFRLQTMLF